MAKKSKDYPENPQTLGQHLKRRRRELGLLQREVAKRMGIDTFIYHNWEMDKTAPVTARSDRWWSSWDTTQPGTEDACRASAGQAEDLGGDLRPGRQLPAGTRGA